MEDKAFKKILLKSEVKTSERFTDDLMVGLIFLFILGINHMLRLSQKVESYNQLVKQ